MAPAAILRPIAAGGQWHRRAALFRPGPRLPASGSPPAPGSSPSASAPGLSAISRGSTWIAPGSVTASAASATCVARANGAALARSAVMYQAHRRYSPARVRLKRGAQRPPGELLGALGCCKYAPTGAPAARRHARLWLQSRSLGWCLGVCGVARGALRPAGLRPHARTAGFGGERRKGQLAAHAGRRAEDRAQKPSFSTPRKPRIMLLLRPA